ncbi:hypothetical protein CCOS191_2450 [Pseudomonas sp. CCOS 191]|nr:hypothetical protein CCOS191_2450 [Pseudomonas sp. CCOS 191]
MQRQKLAHTGSTCLACASERLSGRPSHLPHFPSSLRRIAPWATGSNPAGHRVLSSNMANRNAAFSILHTRRSAPHRLLPLNTAPPISVSVRFAPRRSAPLKSAKAASARERSALHSRAPLNRVLANVAPRMSAALRSASMNDAFLRSLPMNVVARASRPSNCARCNDRPSRLAPGNLSWSNTRHSPVSKHSKIISAHPIIIASGNLRGRLRNGLSIQPAPPTPYTTN